MRHESARGCDVPATGCYCEVGSSDEEDVDNEVADYLQVPLIGEEEHSEKEVAAREGFVLGILQRTGGSSQPNPSSGTAPQVQDLAMPRVGPQSSAAWAFFKRICCCGL